MCRVRYGGIKQTSGCQSVYGLMGQEWNEWMKRGAKTSLMVSGLRVPLPTPSPTHRITGNASWLGILTF